MGFTIYHQFNQSITRISGTLSTACHGGHHKTFIGLTAACANILPSLKLLTVGIRTKMLPLCEYVMYIIIYPWLQLCPMRYSYSHAFIWWIKSHSPYASAFKQSPCSIHLLTQRNILLPPSEIRTNGTAICTFSLLARSLIKSVTHVFVDELHLLYAWLKYLIQMQPSMKDIMHSWFKYRKYNLHCGRWLKDTGVSIYTWEIIMLTTKLFGFFCGNRNISSYIATSKWWNSSWVRGNRDF